MQKEKKYKGLSWATMFIILVITSAILSATVDNKVIDEPKKMKAELFPDQWSKGDKWMNVAKDYLLKSDLQAKTVSVIMDSLMEFQLALYNELQPQFNSLKKIQDSLNKLKVKPKN